MDEKSLQSALAHLPLAGFRFFNETGSTNEQALRWAERGAADGSLVIADSQTAGRGRLNRRWETHPGAALAFSLVMRLTAEETRRSALCSPLGALGVAAALSDDYQLAAQVKWPNDVLLNRRKVSGILAEACWQGGALQGIVLGVGINVAPESLPPEEHLLFPATCVEQALGKPVARSELLRAVLEKIFAWRARLSSPAFIADWEERLAFKGEWVEIQQPNQPAVTGKLLGISDEGNLRLQTAANETVTIVAGDLRLRPVAVEQRYTPGG